MPEPIIIPLRERPELCAFFVAHLEAQWPSWYGPGGEGDATEDLQAFANSEGRLPVGVIALDHSGRPLGIAALRRASIGTHTHLSPWVTSGYVVPAFRGAGIGARLLTGVLAEAHRLGFDRLYCATARAMTLLER